MTALPPVSLAPAGPTDVVAPSIYNGGSLWDCGLPLQFGQHQLSSPPPQLGVMTSSPLGSLTSPHGGYATTTAGVTSPYSNNPPPLPSPQGILSNVQWADEDGEFRNNLDQPTRGKEGLCHKPNMPPLAASDSEDSNETSV
ncbi:uncharacterized protein LOC144158879 [Haemaphysalis longicornis]